VDQTAPPTGEPTVKWEAPPPPRTNGGFDISDFFSFRYLITPTFIRVIYVIGALLITLSAVAYLSVPSTGSGLVQALLVVIVGNLWWRIVLELVMVLFRINDSLAAIERRGRGL
jgi:uncharacterized protein DUF4282